ncbi:MAG: copper resistance protein NlpE [Marinilabiliales bacterium]|nr:copper resistance protein NlpE [Marinilabiliales bacterium]
MYRSTDDYKGDLTLRADGTFTSDEYFPKQSQHRAGSGVWTFDPATLTFHLKWQPDGGICRARSAGTRPIFR